MSSPKDNHFVIVVDIEPKAMPRPRGKAGQHAYMPKAYQEWREAAAWQFKEAWHRINHGPRILTFPINVNIVLQAGRVTVWLGPAMAERHGLTGDVDNYAKAILDVMKDAGVYEDDSQVRVLGVMMGLEEDTKREKESQ